MSSKNIIIYNGSVLECVLAAAEGKFLEPSCRKPYDPLAYLVAQALLPCVHFFTW